MSMSDRIAIMLEGHVEQLGRPGDGVRATASAFVAGFIGRNNFWRGTASDRLAWLPTTAQSSSSRTPDEQVDGGQRCARGRAPGVLHDRHRRIPEPRVNVIRRERLPACRISVTRCSSSSARSQRDLVVLLPRQQAPKVAPGDDVWCRWESDDVYMFSARQADLVLADPTTESAGQPA